MRHDLRLPIACFSLLALTGAALAESPEPAVDGEPAHCLLLSRVDHVRALDAGTFEIEAGSNRYLSEVSAGCEQAVRNSTRIELDVAGSTLCSGERVRVVHSRTGSLWGACTLGDFQPVADAAGTN